MGRTRVRLIQAEGLGADAQLAARYIGLAGYSKLARATQFALNQVARSTAKGVTAGLAGAVDRPTPFTQRAFGYRLGDLKAAENGREPASEVYVQPLQSAYLKYGVGEGPQVRTPGDVGLAESSILVPLWKNITLTQGVRPTSHGNVPRALVSRLLREARGVRAASRRRSAWGVYWGRMTMKGQEVQGLIARPPRAVVDARKDRKGFVDGRGRVASVPRVTNRDVPRMLLVKSPRATYSPYLQPLLDREGEAARKLIPSILEAELAERLRHQDAKFARMYPGIR